MCLIMGVLSLPSWTFKIDFGGFFITNIFLAPERKSDDSCQNLTFLRQTISKSIKIHIEHEFLDLVSPAISHVDMRCLVDYEESKKHWL